MPYVKTKSGTVIETANVKHWPEAERIPDAEGKRILHDEAMADLKALVVPGSTVYTILRHVSSSGMTRRISCVVVADNKPRVIDGLMIRAGLGDRPRGNKDGVSVGGCGMDMGFHLVYNLSARLFDDGYNLKHSWL